MNKFLSMAALSCALPLHAMAQVPAPASVPADSPCRADPQQAERAAAALPARAGTHPMPERGTVAPANRVPSQVVSASSQAMAAATARREAEDAKKNHEAGCLPAAAQTKPAEGDKRG